MPRLPSHHALSDDALAILSCTIQGRLQYTANASLTTKYNTMLNVREDAITHDINMCVQHLIAHLHPDKNRFEQWANDRFKNKPVGFLVQETIKRAI